MKCRSKNICFLFCLLLFFAACPPSLAELVTVPVPSEEAKLHSVLGYFNYFWSTFYSIGLLLAFTLTGASAKLRDFVDSKFERTWVRCVVFLLLLALLLDLAYLPETFVSGYALPHYFKLSTQSFVDWFFDTLKIELIGLDSFVESYGILFFLIRKYDRSWPIFICAYQITMSALTLFLYPSVLAPILNSYEPMPECSLRTQIEDLTRKTQFKLDVPIVICDASKQTTSANACVEGFGPSTRIVIWDNTLKKMPEKEIVAVLAHEVGHYKLHHIYWQFFLQIVYGVALVPIYMIYAKSLYQLLPAKCGIRALGDWAITPVFLLVSLVLGFIAEPFSNGYSRFIENQADEYALSITDNGAVYARAMIDLGSLGLNDPNVHPLIEFWLFTHPSITKRVERANRYTVEHH